MPSYFLKALENTQSILCGLFIVWGHFCSRKTASHRTALDFRGIFVLLEAGGLSPANDKRAKSSEKAGCPTCLPLLIDASIAREKCAVSFLFPGHFFGMAQNKMAARELCSRAASIGLAYNTTHAFGAPPSGLGLGFLRR